MLHQKYEGQRVTPSSSMSKRKIAEVEEFLKDYEFLKDSTPRSCHVIGCNKKTHGFGIKGGLGWGPKGGDRVSCGKHKLLEHVEQNHQCIYIGCELRGKQNIGGHKFCATHLKDVKSAGNFPAEFTTRQKQAMCKHPGGCTLQASYDNHTRCRHTPRPRNRMTRGSVTFRGAHPRRGLHSEYLGRNPHAARTTRLPTWLPTSAVRWKHVK